MSRRPAGAMTILAAAMACGGEPPTGGNGSEPEPEFDIVVMARITSGSWHSCAISGVGSGVPNGTAYCWGRNDAGQLGAGVASPGDFRPNPVRVLGPALGTGLGGDGETLRFQWLAAGDEYTCGLDDGRLFCWGGGMIGGGTTRPVLVSRDLNLRVIGGGESHVCVADAQGTVSCLGENDRGQLGDGSTSATDTPTPVGGVLAEAITAGRAHTCVLAPGGVAHCWGANEHGQVGDGTLADAVIPREVVGGHRFVALTAGRDHTCGITVAQEAYCWGSDEFGQLGNGTEGDTAVPTAVEGGLSFATITAGHQHTCAATPAKAGYCWGTNEVGQIGNEMPAGTVQAAPDSVHTDRPFLGMAAGRYHTCMTSRDLGYCWGGNAFGQLGNGSQSPNPVPKLVVGKP